MELGSGSRVGVGVRVRGRVAGLQSRHDAALAALECALEQPHLVRVSNAVIGG